MNKTMPRKAAKFVALVALIATIGGIRKALNPAVVWNCRALTLGMRKSEVLTAMAQFKPIVTQLPVPAHIKTSRRDSEIRFEHQPFIRSQPYVYVNDEADITVFISCGDGYSKMYMTTGSGGTYPPLPPNHSVERPAAQ